MQAKLVSIFVQTLLYGLSRSRSHPRVFTGFHRCLYGAIRHHDCPLLGRERANGLASSSETHVSRIDRAIRDRDHSA